MFFGTTLAFPSNSHGPGLKSKFVPTSRLSLSARASVPGDVCNRIRRSGGLQPILEKSARGKEKILANSRFEFPMLRPGCKIISSQALSSLWSYIIFRMSMCGNGKLVAGAASRAAVLGLGRLSYRQLSSRATRVLPAVVTLFQNAGVYS